MNDFLKGFLLGCGVALAEYGLLTLFQELRVLDALEVRPPERALKSAEDLRLYLLQLPAASHVQPEESCPAAPEETASRAPEAPGVDSSAEGSAKADAPDTSSGEAATSGEAAPRKIGYPSEFCEKCLRWNEGLDFCYSLGESAWSRKNFRTCFTERLPAEDRGEEMIPEGVYFYEKCKTCVLWSEEKRLCLLFGDSMPVPKPEDGWRSCYVSPPKPQAKLAGEPEGEAGSGLDIGSSNSSEVEDSKRD